MLADTPVPQGTIDGETWTAENSPYIVNGDLTIEDLTIQAGVEIIFANKHKFEVSGRLQANGFYSDSIYFKPAASNPNGWEGIKFKNTSIASSLSYCRIEGAVNQGILVEQVQPAISNCRIVNNVGNGIRLKDASLEIKHCVISNNTINGIFLDVSQISVSNSIISWNTLNGVYSNNAADVITLINTVIADNQNLGISCQKGALTVKNSIVFDNTNQIFIVDRVPDVTYSAIQGASVYPGTGNINSLPDFEGHTFYTLMSQSPCVDAGNPNLIYNDKYFPPSLGTARNDMGAYGGPEANGWFPPLYIKPQIIDFGKVTQDSSAVISASILNYRNTGIAVSEIEFQGDIPQVFSADKQSFVIPVSDSLPVQFFFTPDRDTIFHANAAMQTLSHGKVILPLSGEGIVAKMNLMISQVNFGQVTLGKSDLINVPIQNRGSDTLRLNLMLNSGTVYNLNMSSLKIGPFSSSAGVTVMFTPDLPVSYTDSLIILSNDPSRSRISVPLTGQGVGPVIQVDSDLIDFGTVSVFSDSVIDLTISNSGNSALIIDSLRISGQHPDSIVFEITPDIPALPINIAPGNNVAIPIRFTPIDDVLSTAQLLVKSNDPFREESVIGLSGTGIAGSLQLSSTELKFNQVSVYSQSTLDLIIGNSGLDNLVMDNLGITGQHPDSVVFEITSVLPALPTAIPPDSNLFVQVGFSPIATGAVSAQLVITYDDPFRKDAHVRLSGTGIAGELILAPDELDFGEVSLNSQAIRELTIDNTGLDQLVIDSLEIAGQHPDSIVFEFTNELPELPITIAPDSSVLVKIGFSPIKAGTAGAEILITCDDPFRRHASVPLNGTGIAGALILSTTSLDFEEVAVGKSSILDFTLSNSGDDALTIDSLRIAGQDADGAAFNFINMNPQLPWTLEPDSSVTVQISFSPVKSGIVDDTVRIKSSDPLRNMAVLLLRGVGIAPKIELSATAIDFGQVSLESDSSNMFNIYNTGPADLFIPFDSLSISGSQAAAFSIQGVTEDMIVAPDDSAIVTITFQPLQTGTHQAVLKIVCNDPDYPVSLVTLTGRGYNPSPVSISFNQLLSSNPFTYKQSATIGFKIDGSQFVDSAFVYIRPGGGTDYVRLPLIPQDSENWSAQIDASFVTERGLEYYVNVLHAPTSTNYPVLGSDMPAAVQVTVPELAFPWQTKQAIYQMISIPLETSGQDLSTLFQDELGPYDNTKYRIYELPDGTQYDEVTRLDKTLPPGQAIWLITKDPHDLSISGARSVVTDRKFELHLQAGWNLIASPFAFPIDWNQVSTDLALRYYDGSDWPFVFLMEPFKGYAVRVPSDTMLLIPAQESNVLTKTTPSTDLQKLDGWRIQISAQSNGASDLYNYAGAIKQATSEIDSYDSPEPLPIGDYISLYLAPENSTIKYSTDYRQPGIDHYIFEFGVYGNITDQLSIFLREENLPETYDWIVASEKTGIYYTQNTLQVADMPARFKLMVGTEEFIESAKLNFNQKPVTYQLEQNFPNPFNPKTCIRFSLPEASIVTIHLYNVLGQKVKSMLGGVKKEAGVYQMEWDGTNEIGSPVASGIYFLHLQAGEYNHFIKMILSR